ncbi:hypothetical protein BH10PAT3_BH10PAT3_0390 [soil metagenome]
MTRTATIAAETVFKTKLSGYKKLIDADIAEYAKVMRRHTLQQYGVAARVPADAYFDMLGRGGKRIRGALVMLGYEMSGGADIKMILQAARATEMIHAYLLIMDDIQDRSPLRRGAPTVHAQLAQYHEEHNLGADSEHFGVSLAINAMSIGNHAAQMIMTNLQAPESLRISALSILNRSLIVTAHGQTGDIMAEAAGATREQDIENILEWKTAYYTVLNPLHTGMVLAGADCHATDAITPYAINTGKAFQLRNDIIGTFGSAAENGKSPLDDIREGKHTLLTSYALKHASKADRYFLLEQMGSSKLTQAQFEACKQIVVSSGALKHGTEALKKYVKVASASLVAESSRWPSENVQFLQSFASSLQQLPA